MVALCMLTMPLSLQESLPFWVAAFSWFVGATGMGLAYGSISTLTLELSDPADQGANSAALQVSDSVGSILLIGAAGAVYAASLAAGTVSAATFTTIWVGTGLLAVAGVLVAARIGRPTLDSTSPA
jgi:hypothetical protein